MGPPASICFLNMGTTLPSEPKTLPKRTTEKALPLRLAASRTSISAIRLVPWSHLPLQPFDRTVGPLEIILLAALDGPRQHPLVGIFYGIGVALIVDEFALLLDLRNVYWANAGRWSIDLAVLIIAVGGTLLAATPIFRHLRQSRAH